MPSIKKSFKPNSMPLVGIFKRDANKLKEMYPGKEKDSAVVRAEEILEAQRKKLVEEIVGHRIETE